MNFGPLLFLGLLITMSFSWGAFILAPQVQLGQQKPALFEDVGQIYPFDRSGESHQGQEIYRQNGCYYCHTRLVTGNDLPQWGSRITVAQDYLYDQPVMLGRLRVGPDLANVGARNTDIQWHLLHLYNPQITSKGSTMPSYRFLFEERRVKPGQESAQALKIPAPYAPKTGIEVVPKRDAHVLVQYLLSQRHDFPLLEAPLPKGSRPAAAVTNAVAGSTNPPGVIVTNASTNQVRPALTTPATPK